MSPSDSKTEISEDKFNGYKTSVAKKLLVDFVQNLLNSKSIKSTGWEIYFEFEYVDIPSSLNTKFDGVIAIVELEILHKNICAKVEKKSGLKTCPLEAAVEVIKITGGYIKQFGINV